MSHVAHKRVISQMEEFRTRAQRSSRAECESHEKFTHVFMTLSHICS